MKQEENEFMRHELRLPELTVRGMILGAILTVIFTSLRHRTYTSDSRSD